MKSPVLLLLAIISLTFVYTAEAASCPYSCTRQVRYYTRCGWFGWSRCARYRTETGTCYRTCVHGGWSDWTVATRSVCSVTCGGGTQTVSMVRTCTNPAPSGGGNQCTGDSTMSEQQACNTQNCPIDGGWTDFTVDSIGECSVSCGGGQQTVTSKRTCTSPTPQYGGKDCEGDATKQEQQHCNTHHCPIDGGWSAFTVQNIGECSVTCGGGQQTVTSQRWCKKPKPQYGGKDCEGEAVKQEQQTCNTNPCPIDGGWSDWGDWQDYDECSVLCGGGTIDQWRARTCDNPAPQYGGKYCDGPAMENGTFPCNTDDCGDVCPEGQSTYVTNENNSGRYYQCDNGVARLMECAAGTVWDQESKGCVNDGSQQAPVHVKAGDQCDPTVLYHTHEDCSKFVICLGGVAYEQSCPPGTRWNADITACDLEANVPCPNAK